MPEESEPQSSILLLERLRVTPGDPVVWAEFDRRYRPRILEWCRDWGVQPADADDVAQAVLAKLLGSLPSFKPDPSRGFRGWLRLISRRTWLDLIRRRKDPPGGLQTGHGLLENLEARSDLERRLAETFDAERLETAIGRVRLRVAPATWEAFRLTAVEGKSGEQVSQALGLSIGQVYVAKHRVQKMLRAELGASDPTSSTDGPTQPPRE